MKKQILFLATLLVTALAHAAFPIEGAWGTQQTQNGINFDITFVIANNSLTLINICSMNGSTAKAQVTVPATYDFTSMTSLQSAYDEQRSPDLAVDCNVNIQPEKLNYVVQGNSLILTQAGSAQQMILIRR